MLAAMSERPEERDAKLGEDPDDGDDAPAPTPFDHPMFFPAMLFAVALWFGYDGFFSTDPDLADDKAFNRGGFVLWVVLFLYYGYRGLQEMRATEQADAHEGDRPDPIE